MLLLAAPILTTTVLATIRATIPVAVPTALARPPLLSLALAAAVGAAVSVAVAVAVAVLRALPHRLPGLAVLTLPLGAAHPAGVAVGALLASRGTIRARRPVGARAAGELRRGLNRLRRRRLGRGLRLGLTAATIAARRALAALQALARRIGLGFSPSVAAVLGDGGGARQQRQHQRGGDGLLHAHLRGGSLKRRPGRPLTKRMRPPV